MLAGCAGECCSSVLLLVPRLLEESISRCNSRLCAQTGCWCTGRASGRNHQSFFGREEFVGGLRLSVDEVVVFLKGI